ncbi:MAG: BCCT family transporter [Geminicoccaceae bacterium]
MLSRLGFKVEPIVFFGSAALILGSVLAIALYPDAAGNLLSANQDLVAANFGWFYILVGSAFLMFVVWLGLGRYGDIRLGEDDEKPEFGTFGWFAMLFSAGMGIGLLYNGVGEPLTHFNNPPLAEPGTIEAADDALLFTFYHWGFHPWSMYSVVGLSVAYFGFRRKMPIAIRSCFYPVFGDRIKGWVGDVIDIFAVVGTMFGVAASLAIGAKQIGAGLQEVFGFTTGTTLHIIVIAVITGVATLSVVSGIGKGIKRLSQANLVLSGCLLLFLFVVGGTIFMLESFVQNLGYYLEIILQTGFWTDPHDQAGDWQASWTLGYWGWWLAWAPFVGMFVARISRGRTIREFVLAVLIVPTVVSFFWFSIAGDTAIQLVLNGDERLLEVLNQSNGLDVIFFEFLKYFPLSSLTSVVVIIAVFVFFVTSSDSGSLVIDMLTAGGHPNPPTAQRVFWATTEGLVAAVLLLAGGLEAVRSAVASAGLPVAILLILMCVGLFRALYEERHGLLASQIKDAEEHVDEHGYGPPEDEAAPTRA